MVVTKLDTIETLAILGGLGAVLSPIIMLLMSTWVYFPAYPYYPTFYHLSPAFLMFMFSFFTGIIALLLAIRAAGFVSKMPNRAATELIAIGIMVIIVGFITMFNWLSILSGIVILVGGIESDAVWKRVQRARRQTGWPYYTVATATGYTWAHRLSCQFCGAPLIVKTVTSHGHSVQVYSQCPLDKTTETITLPLSQLEAWSPFLTDRLHRCEQCGNRTAALIVIGQDGMTTRLQAFCPHGHSNRFYRTIWTPLYPHVARTPAVDVGFQIAQIHPRFTPSFPTPQTQPHPQSIRHQQYCNNCGVRIDTTDRFCFRCGNQIR
jgi:hypothetical protein